MVEGKILVCLGFQFRGESLGQGVWRWLVCLGAGSGVWFADAFILAQSGSPVRWAGDRLSDVYYLRAVKD